MLCNLNEVLSNPSALPNMEPTYSGKDSVVNLERHHL